MAFPSSPVDGQLYTTPLGTQYKYVLIDTAWKIVGCSGGSGDITGSGTASYLAKFSDTTTIADSPFYVAGTQPMLMSTYCNPTVSDGSNVYIGGGGNDSTQSGGDPSKGSHNTALGKNSMLSITDGWASVAVGKDALKSCTTGQLNVAVGYQALEDNVSGQQNVAVGTQALNVNTGTANTAVGHSALVANTSGGENVAVGVNSGGGMQTGIDNVMVGTQAGLYYDYDLALTDATYCTYLGYNTKSGANGSVNETVLGSNSADGATKGLGSHSTIIGNTDTTKTAIYGKLGVENTAPLGIFHPIQDGSAVTTCIAGNVGPTVAVAGTFVRDATQWPTMTREDTGTLTDDGELRIIGYETDVNTNFGGTGFLWGLGTGTDPVHRANFSFGDTLTLYNVSGGVTDSDTDSSLCLLLDSNTASMTNTLRIKNRIGNTTRIGYWVKYWQVGEM